MIYTVLLAASSFVSVVFSHGIITSPPVRAVGPAMTAACGASIAALITADNTSHVEGEPEAAAQIANFNSTACNVFMCKGLQFADNTANVQTFKAGQVVNMLASIPIPHEGPMNVSVVNTKTNTAVGAPLISFDSYADESLAELPANNTNFNVTIPSTLGSTCSVAGDCVLQWFWFGTSAVQTYESCVDMVVLAGNGTVNGTAAATNGTANSTTTGAAPAKATVATSGGRKTRIGVRFNV